VVTPVNPGTLSGAATAPTAGLSPSIMRDQVKKLDRSVEAIQTFHQSGTPPTSWEAIIADLQSVRGYVEQFQEHLRVEMSGGGGATGMSGST
jgi:hypothetical protein